MTQDDLVLIKQAVREALSEVTGAVRPEFLTTEDAAAYISISVEQLNQWRSHGGGPTYVKLARLVRYPRRCLDEFMEARLREHTA